MRRQAAFAIAVCVVAACGHASAPTPTTGLTGLVVRGPITPVCQLLIPCEAPFSAGFTVQQQGAVVTTFRSDAEGRFTIALAPGTYRIIPNADAPIIVPAAQAKTVDVGPVGLTEVRLAFDTGLR